MHQAAGRPERYAEDLDGQVGSMHADEGNQHRVPIKGLAQGSLGIGAIKGDDSRGVNPIEFGARIRGRAGLF